MTDYSASKKSWKKREIQGNWKSLLAIFITIVLLFAIFNGLIKAFSLKKYLGESRWDGKSSFATILVTSPPSVFIYQKDPQRIAILQLSENYYFETGKRSEPLKKLSEIVVESSGEELVRIMSINFGAKINSFVTFSERIDVSSENTEKLFKSFASPLALVKIFGTRLDGKVENTNITRIDLFRLWWQLKSLGVERMKIVNISSLGEEIIIGDSKKVLGVDDASLHIKISEYLENRKLLEDELKVEVVNASGNAASAELAVDFVRSLGLEIVNFESSEEKLEETRILTSSKNSYPALYLASLFECDIFGSTTEGEIEQIKIILGKDFADRYFR